MNGQRCCKKNTGVAWRYLQLWSDFLSSQFLLLLLAFRTKGLDYLKMQHIERSDAPMLDLSPKERQRVHNLINDPETAGDQIARKKNVKDALAIFLEHQLWEKAHPGELWDAPKK